MSRPDPRWDVTQAEGLEVVEGEDWVRLVAHTPPEREFLRNANEKLKAIRWAGVAPKILTYRHVYGELTLERIGATYVGDEMAWLWGACDLLAALTESGIKHGDLSAKNLRHRRDRPMAIDFQESIWTVAEGQIETKRPEPDAEVLWRSAVEITGDRDRRFRRWQAIKPWLDDAGILDLGCSWGHFSRLAEVDSPALWVAGFDIAPMPSWPALESDRLTLHEQDVLTAFNLPDGITAHPKPPTAFVLSTWSHLVQQTTLTLATDWLRDLVKACGQVFFEPHLFGDGPGRPEEGPGQPIHPTDGMVANWLRQKIGCREVTGLCTLPVHGREAARTVWRLTT